MIQSASSVSLPPALLGCRVYATRQGTQLWGNSRKLLAQLPPASVDLIMTSPPFALLRKKSYGNKDQDEYVQWLAEFGQAALPVLKSTGSLVMDLGGAYQQGAPVRSLYPYRVLLSFCDDLGYFLAQEMFWHNPAKLPSPAEWVTRRKIRVKDSVNTVWWFSKTPWPKADSRNVRVPYSEAMRTLLQKGYKAKLRPSGHDISDNFSRDNGGALPPSLLSYPNTDSNSHYLRTCRALGRESHPARFPADLPGFFIKFLTEPGDVVLDIFSGSNTTGHTAEGLDRKWIAMEERQDYAALSAIRFLEGQTLPQIQDLITRMEQGGFVEIPELQGGPL